MKKESRQVSIRSGGPKAGDSPPTPRRVSEKHSFLFGKGYLLRAAAAQARPAEKGISAAKLCLFSEPGPAQSISFANLLSGAPALHCKII